MLAGAETRFSCELPQQTQIILRKQAGMKLRHEIYEPGDSRDVNAAIEKFLGRKQSTQPFLKKIGIGPQEKKQAPPGPTSKDR